MEIVKIRLSENLQAIVTAITGSASLAVVGSIIAEFLVADAGIGYIVRVALNGNKLDAIMLALLLIGVANWFYLSPLEWMGKMVVRRILHRKNSE